MKLTLFQNGKLNLFSQLYHIQNIMWQYCWVRVRAHKSCNVIYMADIRRWVEFILFLSFLEVIRVITLVHKSDLQLQKSCEWNGVDFNVGQFAVAVSRVHSYIILHFRMHMKVEELENILMNRTMSGFSFLTYVFSILKYPNNLLNDLLLSLLGDLVPRNQAPQAKRNLLQPFENPFPGWVSCDPF